MRDALDDLGLELLSVNDVKTTSMPEETGETFAENATRKAHYYYTATGIPTVADDSGIVVEALHGELGVHTRRWGAGPFASDEEWIACFLERMRNEKNKRAKFVCSLAHIDAQGRLHVFEGMCEGVVTATVEAPYPPGLPIAGCFRPNGESAVFSALPLEQKNRSSHRGQALNHLRALLQRNITV